MKSIRETSQRKRILKILFLLYCIVLLLLAVLPINSNSSSINDTFIVNIRLDYLLHILIFLPFLPLAMYPKPIKSQRKGTIKLLSLIMSGILFAVFTETIQLYLPYRTFNINDLIANILGIIMGLIIMVLMGLKIRMHKPVT